MVQAEFKVFIIYAMAFEAAFSQLSNLHRIRSVTEKKEDNILIVVNEGKGKRHGKPTIFQEDRVCKMTVNTDNLFRFIETKENDFE